MSILRRPLRAESASGWGEWLGPHAELRLAALEAVRGRAGRAALLLLSSGRRTLGLSLGRRAAGAALSAGTLTTGSALAT